MSKKLEPQFKDSIDLIDNYINSTDWRVKEDSNKSYSLHGLSTYLASTAMSRYWLYKVYTKEIRDAHINADMHIHDLGFIATYCNGWDLKDVLLKGYTGVPGIVSCAPPKHLNSAIDQVINFMYTVRHEAAGAQAISSVDTYLAPFIRYDKLSYKEVKQMLQQFVYNLNVPLDKGFQAPFSNITLDIIPSGTLAEESVVIGGKLMKEQYKDFDKERMMFNKAYAEVMMEGDANGRIFTWPIPTYNITTDFPWDEPMLDPLWEMTAKYGAPYFSNFINSDMKPDDVRSMCCRLRIDNRELRKRGGGLFGANPLTGSVGIVTINLAKLGYLSKTKSKNQFFKRLRKVMDLAKKSLEMKRAVVDEMTERGLYPYSRFYLRDVKKRFGSYWKNHFNTVGLNGMNEACLNYMGKDLLSGDGRMFALEVLNYMREVLVEYQEETGNVFNLEASPAEAASYRFAKKDLSLYPDIIVANARAVKKKGADPYYSNSTQLNVDTPVDLFDALDNQDELQTKYTGGTVFHIFLGERLPSIESTKRLVKKIAENYKMPYFSITPTFSVCPKHGYIEGEHEYCPKCDEEIGYYED